MRTMRLKNFSAGPDDIGGDRGNDTIGAGQTMVERRIELETVRGFGTTVAALRETQSCRTRLVWSEQDRQAVGRLRYEHFIARDKKTSPFADHDAGLFLEPVDALSVNFFVPDGEVALAAVRLTSALDAVADDQLLQVVSHSGLSANDLSGTMVISRLVVRNEVRARLQLPGLFREVYRVGRATGARYCVMASRSSLVALYRRLGFIPNGRGFVNAEASVQRVAIFDALDRGTAAMPHMAAAE